ncbi:MAG TPA: hypothetical protein VD813_07080, partial [Pseudonocardia sp.]|nr:hypothetical protein [Pseudonocardia sp.]
FHDGTVGTLTTTSTLGWKHRAGLEITADGLVLGVGEDWLEVRDGDGSERVEYDPWEARVAADRAFVDVLHGPRKAVTPPDGSGLPDYAEALRSHRLACALARSAERRSPETVQ